MKFVKKLWNNVSHPLPNDHYPIIAMYSNQEVVIEQVEQLLSFTNEHISFTCLLGDVHIFGQNLLIVLLKQNEIIVKGIISEVKFYPTNQLER